VGNGVARIQQAPDEQEKRERERYYELVTHNALLTKFEETESHYPLALKERELLGKSQIRKGNGEARKMLRGAPRSIFRASPFPFLMPVIPVR
jgi:hypothetical protein